MVPLNQKIVPLIFFHDNLIKKKRIKKMAGSVLISKKESGAAPKFVIPSSIVILESGKCAQFSLDEKKNIFGRFSSAACQKFFNLFLTF